jgi:hypothetical protein
MNCDEYREAITANPSRRDDDGHADTCAACRDYRAEIAALDAEIARALALDVPAYAPPVLPDLETDDVATLPARRNRTRPAWLALAAAVAVVAVLGVRMLDPGTGGATLAEQVLAHVDHEPQALLPTNQPVSDAELRAAVPANVSTLDQSAGVITYVRSCEINGRTVPHLVIQGEAGPVTILLMPEEPVSEAIPLRGEHVNGVILPVGSGSVAIIGTRDERLEHIQREVLNSVTWTT